MLKKEYEILKLIKNSKEISESELLRKYPLFKDYIYYLNEYISIVDNGLKKYEDEEEKLITKSLKLKIPIGEQKIYIEKHLPDFKSDSDNIIYSLNRIGLEYMERKQHEFWSFILPYGITTLIAASAVIAQIIEIITQYF